MPRGRISTQTLVPLALLMLAAGSAAQPREPSDNGAVERWFDRLRKTLEARPAGQARSAIRAVFSPALPRDAGARLSRKLGQWALDNRNAIEAVQWFKLSRQLKPTPGIDEDLWKARMANEARAPDAGQIVRALVDVPMIKSAMPAGGSAGGPELRVTFEYDRDVLDTNGAHWANALAEALKKMTGRRFKLVGHTDEAGNDNYNQGLSERRAVAVREYLIARHGIEPHGIETEGHGKREPLYPGEMGSSARARLNRRVQLEIIEP